VSPAIVRWEGDNMPGLWCEDVQKELHDRLSSSLDGFCANTVSIIRKGSEHGLGRILMEGQMLEPSPCGSCGSRSQGGAPGQETTRGLHQNAPGGGRACLPRREKCWAPHCRRLQLGAAIRSCSGCSSTGLTSTRREEITASRCSSSSTGPTSTRREECSASCYGRLQLRTMTRSCSSCSSIEPMLTRRDEC
jgi:hypothetical protein